MGIDDKTIRRIVQRILSVSEPERIILFGSAAESKMTRDSDIDLLIVERNPQDRREESVKLTAELRGLGYPFDIIVVSSEWFETTKNIIGGIVYPAHKYGKVIYDAA